MSKPHSLKLLSYNIHQGLTLLKKKETFRFLKESIKELKVDLLLLQEVAGSHHRAKHELPSEDEALASQLEALADESWPYHAYGKNSVFSGGFHGNAILSRYPITNWGNVDITVPPLQARGCLHAEIQYSAGEKPIHVFAVHLGLLQTERRLQVTRLSDYIRRQVSDGPLLMAGDFNDWRESISKKLNRTLEVKEAYRTKYSRHARTFPSQYPVLCLDRIYYKGVHLKSVARLHGKPWNRLSDHLPLTAEFTL